jgi:basic membrane protein A and related proteins
MIRTLVAALVAVSVALVLAACGGNGDEVANTEAGQTQTGGGGEPFKVGFIYLGPPGDAGWTYTHDQARKYIEDHVDNVETVAIESVPEANAGPALDQLIAQGAKLIFATSFGYGDAVLQKAKLHPDVLFEHATGFQRADNVSTYYVNHWEPSYLQGMIAGSLTKTNTLGYVGSFPIPEVIRDVNAYTLGAQSVNPDVKVKVVLINGWFDPPKEKQAARSLVDAGADVLFGIEDSPSVLEEAAAQGVLASTWNSDMTRFGPEAFLSANVLDWGEHYVARVEAAMDGSWKSEDYWGSVADGSIGLAPYGDSVTQDVRDAVDEKLQGFKDGTFNPFVGPIEDQTGKVRVPDGQEMEFGDIVGWNWYVQGIEGKLPG